MTPDIHIQRPTVLRIAASYIERFSNNGQQASTLGLHQLTMSTQRTAPTPDHGSKAVLIASAVVALWFLNSYAFRYLTVDRDRFGIYWPRREWLYIHIVAGMLALLLGPLQLWLGLNRREMLLHRILGAGYVLGVAISGTAALSLARHTDFGWVFGMGLSTMALAWMVATTFAAIAIYRRLTDQHREWMIRSYVLTFGFVTFRVFIQAVQVAGVGTTLEQMTAASWLSWSVPLLITEWVIQGRKILNFPRRTGYPSSTNVRVPPEEILKLDESCISDTKSETSNWTV